MQDEPDDNHEGEKDIECNRNRKVWKTEVIDGSTPDTVERGSLQQDTHHYIDGVSSRRRDQFVGGQNTYPSSQGTRSRGRRWPKYSWHR